MFCFIVPTGLIITYLKQQFQSLNAGQKEKLNDHLEKLMKKISKYVTQDNVEVKFFRKELLKLHFKKQIYFFSY